MLTRAFHDRKKAGPTKSPRGDEGSGGSSRSRSHQAEEEEEAFGHLTDLPLTFCCATSASSPPPSMSSFSRPLGLREVLQSSVQVLGESGFGISEKVILWDGAVFAAKRFRRVVVGKGEFGRRVDRLAHVSARCEYLVPLRAYVYAKRTKVVLCDYYPMGSLADLLAGAREIGHTPLDWSRRVSIILHVVKAIAFIHAQSPMHEKHLQMNVHGNVKASNVLIKTDLSACLSDYGFFQLAERPKSLGWPRKTLEITDLAGKMSQRCDTDQKCDIYSFGIMLLDLLGGSTAPFQVSCIRERKVEIKEGKIGFFEFYVEGKAKQQALQVLEIALACTNQLPEARPKIDQILVNLRQILSIG